MREFRVRVELAAALWFCSVSGFILALISTCITSCLPCCSPSTSQPRLRIHAFVIFGSTQSQLECVRAGMTISDVVRHLQSFAFSFLVRFLIFAAASAVILLVMEILFSDLSFELVLTSWSKHVL